jgi:hypothetical protein
MIEPFRYPVATGAGRTGLVVVAGAVLAVALGVRDAVALLPAAAAVVPAAAAGVVLVLLAGYLAHVLVADGADPSPPGVGLRSVAGAGVRALALSVAVLLVPAVLLGATVLAFVEARATSGEVPPLFLVGSTAALVAFMAAAYGLPAAVAAVTRAGRLWAAVDADAVVPVLTDPAYVARWTVGFPLVVLAVGAGAVTVGSADVTGLLAALVAAYLLLAGVRAVGEGCDRGADATG